MLGDAGFLSSPVVFRCIFKGQVGLRLGFCSVDVRPVTWGFDNCALGGLMVMRVENVLPVSHISSRGAAGVDEAI